MYNLQHFYIYFIIFLNVLFFETVCSFRSLFDYFLLSSRSLLRVFTSKKPPLIWSCLQFSFSFFSYEGFLCAKKRHSFCDHWKICLLMCSLFPSWSFKFHFIIFALPYSFFYLCPQLASLFLHYMYAESIVPYLHNHSPTIFEFLNTICTLTINS